MNPDFNKEKPEKEQEEELADDLAKSAQKLNNLRIINSGKEDESLSEAETVMSVDRETEARLLGEPTTDSEDKPPKNVKENVNHLSGYKSSLKYLRKITKAENPTKRENHLKRKHLYNVRRYERLNNIVSEFSKVENDETAQVTADKGKTSQISSENETVTPKSSHADAKNAKKDTAPTKNRPENKKANATTSNKVQQRNTQPKDPQPSTSKQATTSVEKLGKRLRSPEEQKSAKKTKATCPLKSDLITAIIDRSNPEGKISTENWQKVELLIMRAMIKRKNDPGHDKICQFDGAKWQKGIKIVGCSCIESFNFIKNCIAELEEVWPGAKLEAVPIADIPVRHKVRLWVPPPVMENEETIELLEMQNPDIVNKNWILTNTTDRADGNGRDLVFSIDQIVLNKLREREGVIKLGLGSLKFILPNDK